MNDDQALLKRTLNGDGPAFDEIVRRYQDGLFRHLLRLTGHPEEAEDLTQEAFIRFYRSLRRFDTARPVAPFLFAIATNAWRKRAGQPHPAEQPLDDRQQTVQSSVAEQVMLRLEHEQILAAMARLRPEQREAVSLYYDQGLSYREIARVTRTPVGTVSTRLRRALDTLRRALPREAAGLVLVAGGQAPPATNLVTALQGQAVAPPSLAPAIAQNLAQIAPAGVGVLHSVWIRWKEAGAMAKTAYVSVGLAVIGLVAIGVPRLTSDRSAARPANAEIRQAKQTIMPGIPRGIHLTYRVTSQEFAWPPELIEEGIASMRAQQAVHPQDVEQSIREFRARAVDGPTKTDTVEYWGTMHSLMYAVEGGFCLAYDGKKVATGAASYMVPDFIKQPTAVRSGINIWKGLTSVNDYLPYLGIYQPRMTLFDDQVILSETTPVPTGEKRVYRYRVPNYIDLAHVLQYDKKGRVTSMTIYAYSVRGTSVVTEKYQFADYATVDGVIYPREVIRNKMIWWAGRDGKVAHRVDRRVVFRVISASAESIPDSFFALSTSRLHAQIQDDRYGITYNYLDPSLSVDEASKRAYESQLADTKSNRQ